MLKGSVVCTRCGSKMLKRFSEDGTTYYCCPRCKQITIIKEKK